MTGPSAVICGLDLFGVKSNAHERGSDLELHVWFGRRVPAPVQHAIDQHTWPAARMSAYGEHTWFCCYVERT